MRIALVCAAVVVAAVAAALVYEATRSTGAAPTIRHPPPQGFTAIATWPAGSRPAPAFRLVDQRGRTLSTASLRGRTALITFIDPVCRSLCPLEAKVLMQAARALPAADRPAIVAVSVNPPEDTPANFARDSSLWRLDSSWRWGLGRKRQLASVWRRYQIAVRFTAADVLHTEATYVVDRAGNERALFLSPFTATDVEQALRRIGG